MTFEDAARLDPDEAGGELDAGRWVPLTKNTWRHGEIVGNAHFLLLGYARRHRGWSVAVGDPGTKLASNPDVLRGPDVAIVRSDRRPRGRGVEGWLDGAPDVVVEVVGDAQSTGDLAKKALEYMAAGARRVWVLDPESERVIVYSPPNALRVLSGADLLDGEDVLPGFSCAVSELFVEPE